MNDELNSVFEKYERCMATRGDASPPFGGKFPAGESEKTNKISTPSGAENLIDLGGGGSSASAATDLKQPKKQPSVESIGKQQKQFQPIGEVLKIFTEYLFI